MIEIDLKVLESCEEKYIYGIIDNNLPRTFYTTEKVRGIEHCALNALIPNEALLKLNKKRQKCVPKT